MEKVVVAHCKSYNHRELQRQLNKIFKPYNGLDSLVNPGQRVLLKVNLLRDFYPETAVTTNPELVKALTIMLQEAGAVVVIGDSPGGPFAKRYLKTCYRKSGLEKVAEDTGAELNYNTGQTRVEFSKGVYNKSFILADYILDADLIINLPKLKTHGLTVMTAAVKNLFGAIPGILKSEYHFRMPEIKFFSEMLVDLALCVSPDLNILDGVIGMEGEGPSGGEAKNFGYLAASRSPFALDTAAAYLMGIKAKRVPYLKAAIERGIVADISELDFIGDGLNPPADVKIPSVLLQSNLIDRKLPNFIADFLETQLKASPVFNHSLCTGCRDCYHNCPAEVITMLDNKPVVDLDECIRCFCCQEFCKYQAVEIKRPLLARLLVKLNEVTK